MYINCLCTFIVYAKEYSTDRNAHRCNMRWIHWDEKKKNHRQIYIHQINLICFKILHFSSVSIENFIATRDRFCYRVIFALVLVFISKNKCNSADILHDFHIARFIYTESFFFLLHELFTSFYIRLSHKLRLNKMDKCTDGYEMYSRASSLVFHPFSLPFCVLISTDEQTHVEQTTCAIF